MSVICQKCLCGRTGDVVGAQCKTPNCGGVIEEQPAFHTLVDVLPEKMRCGRRLPHHVVTDARDHWEKFKKNGDRVCSYCGSLHPDDLFRLVKLCADAPEDAVYNSVPEIEPSDKSYKIYVRQPGVRNAMEGGIKFYTTHLPRDAQGNISVTQQQEDEFKRALAATCDRFNRYMETLRRTG